MRVRFYFFTLFTLVTFLVADGASAASPELTIERVGESVVVSWPTNDWVFALESSTNACDEASWMKSAGDVFFASNRLVMKVALTNAEVLVFRLQRPTGVLAIDAETINLSNMNFPAGSTVLLRSQTGFLAPTPNTGAASVFGSVNFIQNVNFGGNPAQFHIVSWDAYGVSPGVFIRPRPGLLPP